ncbi:MAG: type II secretion system F family protein [Flavobacteriia bacterium]|nr:type II secretion system F family protein [Flavobacteriia bacterium]
MEIDLPKKRSERNLSQFLNMDIGGSSLGAKFKFDFYKDLALLLDSGVTLSDSLSLIFEEQSSRKAKDTIGILLDSVSKGETFRAAMEAAGVFSKYEYTTASMGELSGMLSLVLSRLGDYFEAQIAQKRLIIGAAIYPVIVLLTAVGAISFLLIFMIPMFKDVFGRNANELPAITQFMISSSEILSACIPYLLLITTLFSIAHLRWRSSTSYRLFRYRMLDKIPIVGAILKKNAMMRWSSAMHLMLSTGVTLSDAINMSISIDMHPHLTRDLRLASQDILVGKSLSDSLSSSATVSARMALVLKVAEESNRLSEVFYDLSTRYENELKHQSKLISTVLEPLIIAFLGLVVGTILLAMYLPIFEMSSISGF